MAHIPTCSATGAQMRIHNGLLVFQSYSITMTDPLAAPAAVAQFRLNLRVYIPDREVVGRGDGFNHQIPKIPVRTVAVPGHELFDVLE